jgi:RNA polymerase-binding transcription factor DksA
VKAAAPAKTPAKASAKAAPAPLVPKGRTSVSTAGTPRSRAGREEEGITIELAKGPVKMTPFLKKQKQRLVELRDAYLNAIEGVASETIRNENGDSSAFGMHQADAGSDAYDRDFALSLLGKEQDALYEINEALKRIETGTYGLCEGTGPNPRRAPRGHALRPFHGRLSGKNRAQPMSGGWSRPVHSPSSVSMIQVMPPTTTRTRMRHSASSKRTTTANRLTSPKSESSLTRPKIYAARNHHP